MGDKIIAASLQLDIKGADKLSELNKGVSEVKGNLKDTGTAALKTGKDVDVSTGSFGKLKGQIGDLPGPLGQASAGVNKLGGTFKALLANPVVLVIAAIVAGLALLYKAFTNTFAGGQKMEQVFAGIKAAGQALIDNLTKIGSAIVKVFSFDFSGAIDDIKGVVTAVAEASGKMVALTEEAQKLAREQADNDLEQAKRQARLADLRAKQTDPNVSAKEQIAAGKQLLKESQANALADMDLADRVAKNKIGQLTVEKEGAEKNYVEIKKIEADQVRDQTQNSNELKQIGKAVTQAEKQEIADRRAANAERSQERKKEIQEAKALELKLVEDNYLAKLDANEKLFELERRKHNENLKILRKGNLDTFSELVRHNDAVNVLTAKTITDSTDYSQKISDTITAGATAQIKPRADIVINQTQLEKDHATARKAIAEDETNHRRAQIEEVKGLLSSLADIVGRQTIAGKALGIATALINTYQGASEAIKQKSTLPSPFDFIAKAINVAAIIAMGLKTVKAISAVQVPGGGGGGGVGSAPNISVPAAPISPTQTSTAIDQDSINKIGNAATPLRAFVVDTDIENDRSRSERLNRAARLGG